MTFCSSGGASTDESTTSISVKPTRSRMRREAAVLPGPMTRRRRSSTTLSSSSDGGIRWEHHWVNVSTVCAGDYVGLEEIDDGVWNVYFGPLKLGRFLERHRCIEDAYGRLLRSQ